MPSESLPSRVPTGGRSPGLPVDAAALTAALDEFSATVTGDFSVDDILRDLATSATRVLEVDGAGVATSDETGPMLRIGFTTGGPAAELELLQEALQDGPCRHAHRSGEVVNIADLETEGDWPTFQARGVSLGLHAVAAIPLRARGRSWGALNLYRRRPVAFSAEELAAATTLANLATSYLVVTADRDAAARVQEQLADRAMHDPLTRLPVRWVFVEQLTHALAQLAREPRTLGVLFLDLDGLKYVNDTYGHQAGDQLITTCVERIRAALRPADILARLGGDEFVVLLERLADPAAAARVAERVLAELAVPYSSEGRVMRPSASIGVATTDDAGVTAGALIAHADAAMYRAKHAGRGRYEVFDPDLYAADRAAVDSREVLTDELRTAIADGQLEVHYQPILDLGPQTCDSCCSLPGLGPVYAVEALARWNHPERGVLSAGSFIDAATTSGLVLELGAWVLETACRQLTTWDALHDGHCPRRLFVNVSIAELVDPGLLVRVRHALDAAGMSPDRLTLEITETGLVTDPEGATRAITAIEELGCHLAIDDFGTGYSSLSRVVALPDATIKIDQSFAHDLLTSPAASAVVSAVLLLGHDLRRTVVVEGVEDATTLQALRELGVTHVQGYQLARPLPAHQLTEHVRLQL